MSLATFTLDQVASLFNMVGIGAALAFSFFVARSHATRYFKTWTGSYAAAFLSILCDSWRLAAPSFWSVSVELMAHSLSSLLLLETEHRIRHGARDWHLPAERSRLALYGVLLLSGPVAYFFSRDFTSAALLPVLLYFFSHAFLGWSVWRLPLPKNRNRMFLAICLLLIGILTVAYPVFVVFHAAWLGYFILGALNASVGMGMVVFVLDEKNRELQEADRLKDEFLSNVSHELRTPLTAIKSAVAVLKLQMGHQGGEVFPIIEAHTRRLGMLLSDLLDFSILQRRTPTLTFQQMEASELAEATARDLTFIAGQRHQRIVLKAGEEALWLNVEPTRIRQILDNLIVNASKFAPPNTTLYLRWERREGERMVFAVEDEGPGIPEAERERIFTRFYQLEGGNARAHGGLGLGLAIARSLAELHGGTLKAVEPTRGIGARLELELPLAPESVRHPDGVSV